MAEWPAQKPNCIKAHGIEWLPALPGLEAES